MAIPNGAVRRCTNRQFSTHSTGGSGCNSAESGAKLGGGARQDYVLQGRAEAGKADEGGLCEGAEGGVRGAGLPGR